MYCTAVKQLFFVAALALLPACTPDKSTPTSTPETGTLPVKVASEDKKQAINEQISALLKACREGNLEVVKTLIAQGADINAHGPEDDTPLYAACWGGHESVVSYLLAHGAVVEADDPDNVCSNFEPLIIACRQEHIGCVKLLLEHADAKSIHLGVANFPAYGEALDQLYGDQEQIATLHQAAYKGDLEILKALLAQGLEVDGRDTYGKTALHTACYYGHSDAILLLIKHGANINAPDNSDGTPLYEACRSNFCNYKHVQLLIDHGAQVHIQDKRGLTPLLQACLIGDDQRVALLLNNGAKVNVSGFTPLHCAAQLSCETIDLLLTHGALLEARDDEGKTPLHCASSSSRATKILLDKGAMINVQDNDGNTPLFMACKKRSVDTVKLLLAYGADYALHNKLAMTPLHTTCATGTKSDDEIIKLLVNAGAPLQAVDSKGNTPLHVACARGFIKAVQVLLAHGAAVTSVNKKGKTPLHPACAAGAKACYTLLVNKGADVNARDLAGKTPLHYACRKNHETCTKFLIQKGADSNVQDVAGKTPLHYAQDYAQKYRGSDGCVEILQQHRTVTC